MKEWLGDILDTVMNVLLNILTWVVISFLFITFVSFIRGWL